MLGKLKFIFLIFNYYFLNFKFIQRFPTTTPQQGGASGGAGDSGTGGNFNNDDADDLYR